MLTIGKICLMHSSMANIKKPSPYYVLVVLSERSQSAGSIKSPVSLFIESLVQAGRWAMGVVLEKVATLFCYKSIDIDLSCFLSSPSWIWCLSSIVTYWDRFCQFALSLCVQMNITRKVVLHCGNFQIRAFYSLSVSFNLHIILRFRIKGSSAMLRLHNISR
jgi:hypothetical protein